MRQVPLTVRLHRERLGLVMLRDDVTKLLNNA
jgi:hypothetical protein